MAGAFPIIAVDIFDNRLDLAKTLGATHTINSHSQDANEQIARCLNGSELDCFIDNTGSGAVIEAGYKLTSSQGRLVLVGVPKFDQFVQIKTIPLHFGKTICGSHGGETDPDLDIKKYIKLEQNERIDLKPLISNIYSLKEINKAISGMRSGAISGHCLINLDL